MPYIYKTDLFEYTSDLGDAEDIADMLNVPLEDVCEVNFEDLLLDKDTFKNLIESQGDGVLNSLDDLFLIECFGILFVLENTTDKLYFKNIEDAEKFFSNIRYSLNYDFEYELSDDQPVEEDSSVINIREGLSKADKESSFRYNLVQNYLGSRFTTSTRRKLAEALQKNAPAGELYSIMFPLEEDAEDIDDVDVDENEMLSDDPLLEGDDLMAHLDELVDKINKGDFGLSDKIFILADINNSNVDFLLVPNDVKSEIRQASVPIMDLQDVSDATSLVDKINSATPQNATFVQPFEVTLNESWEDELTDYSRFDIVRLMHETIRFINDERAYMHWIYLMPDCPTVDDFFDFADDNAAFEELKELFMELIEDYGDSGLVNSPDEVLEFLDAAGLMGYFA